MCFSFSYLLCFYILYQYFDLEFPHFFSVCLSVMHTEWLDKKCDSRDFSKIIEARETETNPINEKWYCRQEQARTSKNKDEEITMEQGKEKWDETWLRNFLPNLDKLKWNTIECCFTLVSLIWMKESFYYLLWFS